MRPLGADRAQGRPRTSSHRVLWGSSHVSKDVETVERVIPAPPEKIFALLADANRHQDFDGSGTVKAAHEGTPERLKLGSKFGMNMRIVMPYSMVSTVVEFEPNKRIAWQPRPAYPIANRLPRGRGW